MKGMHLVTKDLRAAKMVKVSFNKIWLAKVTSINLNRGINQLAAEEANL